MSSSKATNRVSVQRSSEQPHLQIPAGTWISCRKGRIIYRGKLLIDHDSISKPEVKITSDIARCGYRLLSPPVEIYIVGQTIIQ